MSEILTNGITELYQGRKRVGLVFRNAGGAEHWAISPSYENPGAASTHIVSFKRPTDPKITATTATEFQRVLTDQDIWDSTWTYLKQHTQQVTYDASSTNPPPFPDSPTPGGDQPVTAPQGIDIGTGSLFEGNQEVGALYRDGTATSVQWEETWVLFPHYPSDPADKVDIKGALPGQNFSNRADFLAHVRSEWRPGTRVFTVAAMHYKGNMPTP